MSDRCTATHVVRCERNLDEHHCWEDGRVLRHYASQKLMGASEFSWRDGDPQPRIEITDDMAKRAYEAFVAYLLPRLGGSNRTYGDKTVDYVKVAAMRIALRAALNGDKP